MSVEAAAAATTTTTEGSEKNGIVNIDTIEKEEKRNDVKSPPEQQPQQQRQWYPSSADWLSSPKVSVPVRPKRYKTKLCRLWITHEACEKERIENSAGGACLPCSYALHPFEIRTNSAKGLIDLNESIGGSGGTNRNSANSSNKNRRRGGNRVGRGRHRRKAGKKGREKNV